MPTDRFTDPPTDAEKEKPVLVYIYGPDIRPSYDELIEIKIASEQNGQPFLLIPEPVQDEAGNYNPSVAPVNNTIDHIENTLDHYFKDDGIYSDREFTTIINTHGIMKDGEHYHQLGASLEETIKIREQGYVPNGEIVDSTELFDVLLSYQDQTGHLCTGIVDGSCYSGASTVDLAESIQANGGLEERDIHFFSKAPFDKKAWQPDTNAFIAVIPEMTANDTALTTENLKEAYLEVAGDLFDGIDPSVTEKVFKAGDNIDLTAIPYENFKEKMDYIITNFADVKAEYGNDPRFSDFVAIMQKYDDSNNLSTEFIRRDLSIKHDDESIQMNYPKLLWFSDEVYDEIHEKLGGATENVQLSDEMMRMHSRDFSALDHMERESKLADLSELAKDGKILLQDYDQWSKSLDQEELRVILNKVATQSPAALLSANNWKERLSPDEVTDINTIAINNAIQSSPRVLIESNQWQDSLTQEQVIQITTLAINQATTLSPTVLIENEDWKNTLSEEDAKHAKTAALQTLATHNPLTVLESNINFSDLEQSLSQEIITTALLETATQFPAIFVASYGSWNESLSPEKREESLNIFVTSFAEYAASYEQVSEKDVIKSANQLSDSIIDPEQKKIVTSILDKALKENGIDVELHNELKNGLEDIQLGGIQLLNANDDTLFENMTPTPSEQKPSPKDKETHNNFEL